MAIPFSWECPWCRQEVPSGQANCPNCASPTLVSAPAPPAPPPPAPPAPQPRRAAPATPPPPQAHTARGWRQLWIFLVGLVLGTIFALVALLFLPRFATSSAPVAPAAAATHTRTRRPPASSRAAARQAQPAAPSRIELSGNVDVTLHEAQTQAITALPPPAPARRPTPEELDEATARWLEGQRDP